RRTPSDFSLVRAAVLPNPLEMRRASPAHRIVARLPTEELLRAAVAARDQGHHSRIVPPRSAPAPDFRGTKPEKSPPQERSACASRPGVELDVRERLQDMQLHALCPAVRLPRDMPAISH